MGYTIAAGSMPSSIDLYRKVAFLSVLAVAATLLSSGAGAYSSFQSQIPNGGSVMRAGEPWPGVGHASSSGGGTLNPFGAAWRAAANWSRALCEADSDGDGFTNGQELGDPGCVWSAGETAARTTDISHPGFADSTPTSTAPPNNVTTTGAVTTTLAPTDPPELVFEAQTTAADEGALAAVLRQHVIGALDADVVITSFSTTSGRVVFHFTGTDSRIADQSLQGRPAALRRSQLLLVDLKIAISTTTAAPATTAAPGPGSSAAGDDDAGLSSFAVAAIVVLVLVVVGVCLVGFCVLRHRRASAPKLARSVHRQHRLVFPEQTDGHDDLGDDDELMMGHGDDQGVLSPYRPLAPAQHRDTAVQPAQAEPHHWHSPQSQPRHQGPTGYSSASPRAESALPKIRRVQVHGAPARAGGGAPDPLLERDGFRPSTQAPRADVDDL
jgi:dopamine beta-monooxygenase